MNHKQEKCNMLNWRAIIAVVLALASPLAAMAQNAIQSITSTQQGGAEVVRVELSEPLSAVPKGFSVQTPPRVAIDLPGVIKWVEFENRSLRISGRRRIRCIRVVHGGVACVLPAHLLGFSAKSFGPSSSHGGS